MNKGLLALLITLGVALLIFMGGCSAYTGTYDKLVTSSVAVDKAVSQIDESYRRRNDLIPNYVEAVKAEVGAEQDIVVEYAKARAAMGGQIKLTPEMMNDPKAVAAFQAQQGTMGNVLGRLMMVTEKVPNPNFSQGFRDLRTNLEGLNNRVGIAIRDHNDAVQKHNVAIGSFWASTFFGNNPKFKARPMYVIEEAKKANPEISTMNFNTRIPKEK